MFTIVNTLDPKFFPRVVDELDMETDGTTGEAKPEQRVTVVDSLVDLIEFGISRNATAGNARAIHMLKMGSKKRKAPKQKREYKLEAKIGQTLYPNTWPTTFIKRYADPVLIAKRRKS